MRTRLPSDDTARLASKQPVAPLLVPPLVKRSPELLLLVGGALPLLLAFDSLPLLLALTLPSVPTLDARTQ